MGLIVDQDGAEIEQIKVIKLSKIRNTCSALVHCHSTFIDIMKALLSYTGAFKLEYGVKFVGAPIKNIVDNTLSSEYLPTSMRATYVPLIKLS